MIRRTDIFGRKETPCMVNRSTRKIKNNDSRQCRVWGQGVDLVQTDSRSTKVKKHLL